MEPHTENYTDYIPNVPQHIEALGGWVYVGCTGGATSFFLFCLYMYNVFIYIMKYPSWARRHQAWITSLPMAISFLSLSSFFVPRAAVTCETVKFIYMPFIMTQFVETTLVISGGERITLKESVNRKDKWYLITLTLPFCKCQLVKFDLTKKRLRIIVGLIYQAFVSQVLLTILMAILELAEVLRRDAAYATFLIIFLNILNMLTFTAGLLFFNLLIVGLSAHLEPKWPDFMKKYYALFNFICFQKTHNLFISVVTFVNFESPILTWKTIDAAASMFEAAIFGVFFFLSFKVVVVKGKANTHECVSALDDSNITNGKTNETNEQLLLQNRS